MPAHVHLHALILTCAAACSVLAQVLSADETQKAPVKFIERIHRGDLIDIHVSGHLGYEWRGRLTPEGYLDGYDKIAEQIRGQCRTETEIAADIDSVLSKILRSPRTQVRVLDRSGRAPAVIDGAIRTPHRLQIQREVRLSEVIIRTGGFTDRASGEITISRPPGLNCFDPAASTTKQFVVKISDLLSGDPAANLLIVSGDLIVINEALPVYFIGAIAAQGRLDHRPQMTLARAVDAAGGLQKGAASEVSIFRRDGGTTIIRANLERIRDGIDPDVELRPNDIIDIPFKGRPPRRLPPVMEFESGNAGRAARFPLLVID